MLKRNRGRIRKKAWHKEIFILILQDPTLISINHIQQAHKKANKGYNDLVAQLYQKEFKSSQEEKEEHIKAFKEKALEEQRISEENKLRAEEEQRAKDDATARDDNKAIEQPETQPTQANDVENGHVQNVPEPATNGSIGSNWSSVTPEQASQYMANKTGVSAEKWQEIIFRESSNNPTVTNSIGCYGYLQLHPVHGNVSGMTPQQYLDTAVAVYFSQGLSAWEVTTNGMVN